MDKQQALNSAVLPGEARVLISRGLFFAAVLLGFLLLGIAGASADDDGQPGGKPAAQGSSETGNDTPQNESSNEPADPQPETAPEPETTPQGEGEQASDGPVEDVLDTPPPSDAPPAQPEAPAPVEEEQSTQSMPAEPTSSTPAPDESEPATPAPAGGEGAGGGAGGESGSTEGKTPVVEPVAEGLEETVNNTNELVLDKPEKLAKAAKKTIEDTTDALSSKDPVDRSVRNLTKAATKPLAEGVSDTLDDTVELTRRQADVARKSLTGVRRDLDRVGDGLRKDLEEGLRDGLDSRPGGAPEDGDGNEPGSNPDPQSVPDVDGHQPDTFMLPVPLKNSERVDVPLKRTTSPQVSRASTLLEPATDAASGASSTSKVDSAAQAAAPQPLDISPVAGGASTSSDSTGGGAGSSVVACGAESFTMRLGAGHDVVAVHRAEAPPVASLQPGFSPD